MRGSSNFWELYDLKIYEREEVEKFNVGVWISSGWGTVTSRLFIVLPFYIDLYALGIYPVYFFLLSIVAVLIPFSVYYVIKNIQD